MELKDPIEPIGKAIEEKHGFELAKNFLCESERLAVAMIAGRDLLIYLRNCHENEGAACRIDPLLLFSS